MTYYKRIIDKKTPGVEGFSKKKTAADTWSQTSRKIFCCAPLW